MEPQEDPHQVGTSSSYIEDIIEIERPNIPPSLHERVQAAASEVLMHTYANRRFGQVQLTVTEEDNSAVSSESSDGIEFPPTTARNAERSPTDHLRNEFSRLRQTLNQHEEAQTICTFFTSILPFVTIFVLKSLVDHYGDFGRLLGGIFTFLCLDGYIQTWISAGRCTIQQKAAIAVSLVSGLLITSNIIFPVEDMNVIKCLSLQYAGDSFHGFLTTLLIVVLMDNFAKMITCFLKISVFILPFVSVHQKRRLFQTMEYMSQVYRCLLPGPQWMFYFLGDSPDSYKFLDVSIAAIYGLLKAREIFFVTLVLLDSCRRVFESSNYGSAPTQKEVDDAQMCSICHDIMASPTKLPCAHIFCRSCIDTWLDKEHTCPMCRAVVEKKNNQWKTGGTSKLIRFY